MTKIAAIAGEPNQAIRLYNRVGIGIGVVIGVLPVIRRVMPGQRSRVLIRRSNGMLPQRMFAERH